MSAPPDSDTLANPLSGRVLVAAGSDSGGGAGIQADIKTITALGGYAATTITALTAQNTQGVFGIENVSPAFVALQMRLVLEDIGADAIKTGMLSNEAIVCAVADSIAAHPAALVLDPVMVAKGGAALLSPDAVGAVIARLIPRATIITPNIPEAEMLAAMPIRNTDNMRLAATRIRDMGAKAVLIKGGHMESGDQVHNLLLAPHAEQIFTTERQHTRHTHGTGCTLASAIATGLAQGMPLTDSIARAQHYVANAIRFAPGLGNGHGPLNHGWQRKEY